MLTKKISAAISLVFAGGVLFLAAYLASSELKAQDLAQFWAAAHLVRQNPYSFELVGRFEKASGVFSSEVPLVMRNPPWSIPFILPLGLFSYRVAFALWSVFSVFVVMGCTRAIWLENEKSDSIGSVLLPILFGPTIVLLLLGQWTVLVLLGITTFLIMVNRRRDWIAGAALVLVMGKPHVAFLFLLAIVLWTFRSKRWGILISAALSLACSSMVVLAINRLIFSEFMVRTRQVVAETAPYPNLGGMLYEITHQHAIALAPQIVSVVWFGFYWARRRETWDWASDGMLVLLCSVAFSYYSYSYDETLVLPALVYAFIIGNRKIFTVCFTLVNIGYSLYLFQIAGRFGFSPMFLWWTAIAWLITYVASVRYRLSEPKSTTANVCDA